MSTVAPAEGSAESTERVKTMDTSQCVQNLEQGPVTIRALHSLTQQQAAIITRVVAVVAPRWSVQSCDDYDGYLSVMVEPVGPSPEQPTYYISGTINRIELAEVRQDTFTALACFNDISAVATRLAKILSC